MNPLRLLALVGVLAFVAGSGSAQQQEPAARLQSATGELKAQLEQSLAELAAAQKAVAEEKVPLGRQLRELEAELSRLRQQAAERTRELDVRSQALGNLTADAKRAQEEQTYLATALGDYVRTFDSTLHVAEVQRHEKELSEAKLAAENRSLPQQDVFAAQAAVASRSIDRIAECLGGLRFDGRAVAVDGRLENGVFALLGPIAVFRSVDGKSVGLVEQKLGSLQPSLVEFPKPEQSQEASTFLAGGAQSLPVDPTLGSALKVAATEETLVEHFLAGGALMWPIGVLGIAAIAVALFKWLALSMVRRPSRRQVQALVEAVREKDFDAAKAVAQEVKGHFGRLVRAGTETLHESKELLEEVLFERILDAKFRIQSLLPFLSVAAASAPLLGLLGTVTGIIETFKQITIHGTSDPKQLSGGISEALITTEYGLIVAIPSLLLHALLSRKARALVGSMEALAVQFTNAAGLGGDHAAETGSGGGTANAGVEPAQLRAQIRDVLGELLGPVLDDDGGASRARVG